MQAARDDEEERRRRTEERIRAMQFEQVPLEGGKPKARVGLVSAYVVTLLAAILPLKVRTAFGLAINFVFNQTAAIVRMVAALLSRGVTSVAIFLVYWLRSRSSVGKIVARIKGGMPPSPGIQEPMPAGPSPPAGE